MAHSTAIPAASHSDWYTILCSALIDGLKAYGASLMSIAPIDHLESQTSPTVPTRNAPILRTAGCPIHRAVSSRDGWETRMPISQPCRVSIQKSARKPIFPLSNPVHQPRPTVQGGSVTVRRTSSRRPPAAHLIFHYLSAAVLRSIPTSFNHFRTTPASVKLQAN
jgi:hypothetical protein